MSEVVQAIVEVEEASATTQELLEADLTLVGQLHFGDHMIDYLADLTSDTCEYTQVDGTKSVFHNIDLLESAVAAFYRKYEGNTEAVMKLLARVVEMHEFYMAEFYKK